MHTQRFDLSQQLGDEAVAFLLTFNHNAYGDWVVIYAKRGALLSAFQSNSTALIAMRRS
jgi:hypothetical protein